MKNKFSGSTSVIINSDIDSVWDAITKPELVKQYFFGTNLDTTWEVGSPVYFRGEWEGKSYEDKGKVLSFEPKHGLSMSYWSAASGLPDKDEDYQIVSYRLDEVEGGVRFTLEQSNVDTQERIDHSLKNWEMVLGSLKKLLETSQ